MAGITSFHLTAEWLNNKESCSDAINKVLYNSYTNHISFSESCTINDDLRAIIPFPVFIYRLTWPLLYWYCTCENVSHPHMKLTVVRKLRWTRISLSYKILFEKVCSNEWSVHIESDFQAENSLRGLVFIDSVYLAVKLQPLTKTMSCVMLSINVNTTVPWKSKPVTTKQNQLTHSHYWTMQLGSSLSTDQCVQTNSTDYFHCIALSSLLAKVWI